MVDLFQAPRDAVMSLNIKNPHVHDLAREAARVSGRSQTSVIEEALEEWLARHGHSADARYARAMAIFEDIDARLSDEDRAKLTTDDLYDDRGLPR